MVDHVSDSEQSEVDVLVPNTPSCKSAREPSQSTSVLSHRFRESPQKPSDTVKHSKESSVSSENSSIAVMVSAPARPWEYAPFQGHATVESVLEELEGPDGEIWYKIEFEDGKNQDVSFDDLLKLRNGQNALNFFQDEDREKSRQSSEEPSMSASRGKRHRTKPPTFQGMVDPEDVDLTEEEASEDQSTLKKRRLGKDRVSNLTNSDSHQSSRVATRTSSRLSNRPASHMAIDKESSDSSDSEELLTTHKIKSHQHTSGRNTRASTAKPSKLADYEDELAGDNDSDSEVSKWVEPGLKKQTPNPRRSRSKSVKGKRSRPRNEVEESSSSEERPEPTRRSGRGRQIKSMKENDVDEEIYADEVSVNNGPKVISVREIYQPVPKQSQFARFHKKECDICDGAGEDSNKGRSQLIFCQGCSSSFHKLCIGYRSAREHMVTKVGHDNFVLQCKRCIGLYAKKSDTNPLLDTCTGCHKQGKGCREFSTKKTPKAEQKLREENDGDDPITEVPQDLINNASNLLFRCVGCKRSWHFEHLPAKDDPDTPMDEGDDEDQGHLRAERFKEYGATWQCAECSSDLSKVQGFAAWRPIDRKAYDDGKSVDTFREDEKEYLVKWAGKGYTQCSWMAGAWVWGVTAVTMRKAFYEDREGGNLLPNWTAEEAIPEEYMRIEIVFDVEYDNDYEPHTLASDKDHIRDVSRVLVKFQGLSYEETVWEEPPSGGNAERWHDFETAYNEYLNGIYFKHQLRTDMLKRIKEFRSSNFSRKVELKKQPSSLTGGQVMEYQLDGLNWLLYNYHKEKNVILADEMGLGKTIQIIALIAALVQEKPKCWPFLIVTPNATCANWRREIKKWAPGLRVVAYYGSKHARDTAMEYELYPGGSKELKAHVVITSYEPPVKQNLFFKKIKWAGLIVDEGQRLKNEDGLLYKALTNLSIPFQLLLTGTPLQNNKRELFNLLQFLQPDMNAAELDEKYEQLTNENLSELHDLIRPFFLRRTKAQVLKFLPPMSQVIVPVSMSVVQKKLYKSILAKNSHLIRAILGQNTAAVNVKERGNLNNILMQLRKCLSHPFIYSSAIEERKVSEEALHRNLIDASSKFQLLEIMLPKLRERGHRVLLFSQFLNQLDLVEDFLNGLDLPFQRLDGNVGSIEKQKRIDHFNAPDSNDFAFLLSTRAGGVGINLATADTVIVMDPDFNPHQDIQAFSRAHRIGQKKKVLVFQLMTKDSAEEKIIQIGRKKMALDKALIESMDADNDAGLDVESILKHGAAALFSDDDRNDIRYDSASVDKLLDRTQVENTETDQAKSAESQFSFARVWANDKDDLVGDIEAEDDEAAPDLSVWDKILKEREAEAAAEAAKNLKSFGRGQRVKQVVDYHRDAADLDDDILRSSPPKGRRRAKGSDDDDDFSSNVAESDKDEESDAVVEPTDLRELETQGDDSKAQATHAHPRAMPAVLQHGRSGHPTVLPPNTAQHPRVLQEFPPILPPNAVLPRGAPQPTKPAREQQQHFYQPQPPIGHQGSQGQGRPNNQYGQSSQGNVPNSHYGSARQEIKDPGNTNQVRREDEEGLRGTFSHPGRTSDERRPSEGKYCHACRNTHIIGQCPLKRAGAEQCGLCGLAHFGVSRSCPNLASEIEIRLMLDTLMASSEPIEHIEAARRFLNLELANRSRGKKKQNRRVS